MGSSSAIILRNPCLCGLRFRAGEESRPTQVRQRGGHGRIPAQAPTSCRTSRPGLWGELYLPTCTPQSTPSLPSSGHLTAVGADPAPDTGEGGGHSPGAHLPGDEATGSFQITVSTVKQDKQGDRRDWGVDSQPGRGDK